MNATFDWHAPVLPSRPWVLAFGAVPLALGIAALLVGGMAFTATRAGWLQPGEAAVPEPHTRLAAVRAENEPVAAPARRRCETCAVVESIRRIPATGDTSESHEFTLRMPDGTLRTGDAGSQDWRPGDRVMLIGAARAQN